MEFDELRQRQKKAKTEPNTTEYSFQKGTPFPGITKGTKSRRLLPASWRLSGRRGLRRLLPYGRKSAETGVL